MVRKLAFTFCTFWVLQLPTTALADVGSFEGGDGLLAMCGTPRTNVTDMDSAVFSMQCNMYLEGVVDTLLQTSHDLGQQPLFCLPHALGLIRAGVYDWLHAHSERRNEAAPGLAPSKNASPVSSRTTDPHQRRI